MNNKMDSINQIKFEKVKLDPENIDEEVLKILKDIRPNWIGSRIEKKVFSQGIMNRLFGFYLESEKNDIVVVKIYGEKTDLMIDRDAEIRNILFLFKNNCGPEIYARFENGIAYEFIPGSTLPVDSCNNPDMNKLIAEEMGKMHSLINNDKVEYEEIFIWKKIKEYFKIAENTLRNNLDLNSKLKEKGITLNDFEAVIKEIEMLVKENKIEIPLGFCHNDLLLANIIYNKDKKKLSFIDFEYANVNYIPFDIANHFCEFAGVDTVDFSRCPDDEFKKEWIKNYLSTFSCKERENLSPDDFLNLVNLFMPLAHLFWAIWAIVQASISSIDFDYFCYSCLKFEECQRLLKKYKDSRK